MSKQLSYLALFLSLSLTASADSPCAALETKEGAKVANVESSSGFQPFSGKVKGNRVRLRLQPNLDAQVLRESKPGELFAIIGQTNGFYAVRAPKDMKGYVFRTFVLDNVVEGEKVNIRLAPDMESNVIGQLHKGTKVAAAICSENNKWLEIALPEGVAFYIAREYIEKEGDIAVVDQREQLHQEALHRLSAAFCFAEAELKKSFEQIDVAAVQEKFSAFASQYPLFTDLVEKAKEGCKLVEDGYVNRKMAFLQAKSESAVACADSAESKKLHTLANALRSSLAVPLQEDVKTSSQMAALAAGTFASGVVTDKMLAWQPLEQSCYHVWAADHNGRSLEEYYADAIENATILTGIIESYDRPVKNCPGDYILKTDNVPVAFLYSTKINLQPFVGQKVTVVSLPRPNNHFAFPAYFVVAVE